METAVRLRRGGDPRPSLSELEHGVTRGALLHELEQPFADRIRELILCRHSVSPQRFDFGVGDSCGVNPSCRPAVVSFGVEVVPEGRPPTDRDARFGQHGVVDRVVRAESLRLHFDVMADRSARFARYLQKWWERQLDAVSGEGSWMRG